MVGIYLIGNLVTRKSERAYLKGFRKALGLIFWSVVALSCFAILVRGEEIFIYILMGL